MTWVIDSCIVLDVALADPTHGERSAHTLARLRQRGPLVLCPVSVVEVAPYFGGDIGNVHEFARLLGADAHAPWTEDDTRLAAEGWSRHVQLKRSGQTARRPVADVLIGAFALRTGGLITRNTAHFRSLFPTLKLLEP